MYYLAREYTEGMELVSKAPYESLYLAKQAVLELWQECNGAKGAPYVIVKVVAQELVPESGLKWHTYETPA